MGKIVEGIYYGSDGKPAHRGIVEVDGKIYYAGKAGVLVKNEEKNIHHGMANGLVKHGTYAFDEHGVLKPDSFRPPKAMKENNQKKLTKKQKNFLWGIAVAVVFFCLVTVLHGVERQVINTNENNAVRTNTDFSIELPEFTDEVYLCSSSLRQYSQGIITLEQAVDAKASPYSPFIFKYSIRNASSAVLYLSEQGSTVGSTEYPLDVKANFLSIDNLKTGTTYCYRVTAEDLGGETHDYSGTFTTANTNRFVSFPGVYNTRDIGGYDTLYGKKVRQGVLIRGSEMDGLAESTYYLTDTTATDAFGFVCDFDLRDSDIFSITYVSPLGKDVSHKFYNSPMYGGIFAKSNEKYLKQIFSDLADKNNYPMYMHCTYGADRTGTVVFLLQGLLGVSEEDMKTEYEMTGFFVSDYVNGDSLNSIYSGLQGVYGSTINEKIENYLIDTVGVTSQQIQNIRSIFLVP